ncbi:hypothetical protein Tco_0710879 [Tanacetum coccineum]
MVDVSEEHVVSLYLGGLPTEIEMGVRMFRPKTLADAYQLTNLQEATLEAIKKKNKAVLSSQNGRFGGGRGCEMVLGIQWLVTLGDIKCNFSQLRMEFMYKNKRMTLRGTPKAAIQWLEGKN